MPEESDGERKPTTLATIYRHCDFKGPSGDIQEEGGRYDIDFVSKHVGNDELSAVRATRRMMEF